MGTNLLIKIGFGTPVHWKLLLNAYICGGWSVDYAGEISHLPLNDFGEYDWQYSPASEWTTIQAEMEVMFLAGQEIGVGLFNFDEDKGFTLRILSDTTVILDAQPIPLQDRQAWIPDLNACLSLAEPLLKLYHTNIGSIGVECVR